MFCCLRIASICGREPWTTTRRTPRLCRRLRSCTTPRKVSSATTSPPNAMTTVLPRSAWTYGAAARIHGTNDLASNLIRARSVLRSGGRIAGGAGTVVEAYAVELAGPAADERFGETRQRSIGIVANQVFVAKCVRRRRRVPNEIVAMGNEIRPAVKPAK